MSTQLPEHVQAILADLAKPPAWREPEQSPEAEERQQAEREQRSLAAAKQRIGGLIATMAAGGTSRALLASVLAAEAERQAGLAARLEQ